MGNSELKHQALIQIWIVFSFSVTAGFGFAVLAFL